MVIDTNNPVLKTKMPNLSLKRTFKLILTTYFFILLSGMSEVCFCVFNNIVVELDHVYCFDNNVSADILETEKGIICSSKKKVKLVNYGLDPPVSVEVINANGASHSYTLPAAFSLTGMDENQSINNPNITRIINYDGTGIILLGFTSYRAISYELPLLPTTTSGSQVAVQQKEFNLPNLVNQGVPNPVMFMDIFKNQYSFIVADNGLGTTGVYKYSFADETSPDFMIIVSGIKVLRVKHLGQLSWLAICLSNSTILFYDSVAGQQVLHGEIRHIEGATLETNSSVILEGIDDKKKIATGGQDGKLYLWDVSVSPDENKIWRVKNKIYDVQDPTNPEITHIRYYESSDYFVTADANKWIKIYKISDATLLEPMSKIQEDNTVVSLRAINYSNKVFIATTKYVRIRQSNVLNCHNFCRECSGITPFSCTRCYAGYTLTGANYCQKVCDGTSAAIYYSSLTNNCEPCHSTCERCTSGSDTSCTQCHSSTPYFHLDGSCATACKPGTYEYPANSKNCKLCHPECNTCYGGSNDQCITCYVNRGYNLQSGGYNVLSKNTCQKGCLSGSYLVKVDGTSQGKCLNCHSECHECLEGTNQDCVKCFHPEKMFLWYKGSNNKTGECVDCLNNYKYDNKTENGRVCLVSRELEIVRTPWESSNFNASVSIKLRFMGIRELGKGRRILAEDLSEVAEVWPPYENRTRGYQELEVSESLLSQVDWNDGYFNIELEGFKQDEYNSSFVIRKGGLILDLNLTRGISYEGKQILIASVDSKRMVLKNDKTGVGQIIFRQFETQSEIRFADKADSESILEFTQWITRLLNILNYSVFGVILLTTIYFLFYQVDFSSFVIDYVRVTKLLHRLGLINIKYPLLVETFFKIFHNLLQTGENHLRDQIDINQRDYRGKLSRYGYPLYPLINFSDKYFIYLIILVTYLSFDQVAKYTTQGKSNSAKHERKELRFVGRLKILFIVLLANDLLFSSGRCLLHINFRNVLGSTQALQALIVALIMFLSLTWDITNIIWDNIYNKQMDLIAFYNSPQRIKIYKQQFQDDPKMKHNLSRVTNPDDSINFGLVRRNMDRFSTVKIFPNKGPDSTNKELNYETKYKFSAGIEFCIKGIRLNKLSTKIGRYYNAMSMLKYLSFEIVILSTQTTPLMQTTLLVLIQIFSILVTTTAVYKRVFQQQYIALKNFVLDLGILLYFLYTLFSALCHNGSNSVCFSKGHKSKMFFSLIGIIASTLLVSVFYLCYLIYLGYKKIKKNRDKDDDGIAGFDDEKLPTISDVSEDGEDNLEEIEILPPKKKPRTIRKLMMDGPISETIGLYNSQEAIKGFNSKIEEGANNDYNEQGDFVWNSEKLKKERELKVFKNEKKSKVIKKKATAEGDENDGGKDEKVPITMQQLVTQKRKGNNKFSLVPKRGNILKEGKKVLQEKLKISGIESKSVKKKLKKAKINKKESSIKISNKKAENSLNNSEEAGKSQVSIDVKQEQLEEEPLNKSLKFETIILSDEEQQYYPHWNFNLKKQWGCSPTTAIKQMNLGGQLLHFKIKERRFSKQK